jgi:hypothetical protein
MAHVARPLRDAGVLDETVRVKRTKRHLELDGAAEQAHDDASTIPRRSSPRSRLHADQA